MLKSIVRILNYLVIFKEILGIEPYNIAFKCVVNCSDPDYEAEDTVRSVLDSYDSDNEIFKIQNKNSNPSKGFNETREWNKLELWKTFWSEWDAVTCSATDDCENSASDETIPICYNDQEMRYEECTDRTSFDLSRACVGVKSRAITHCKTLVGKDMHIPICKEKLSNKVITCEKAKSAFLCFSIVDNETSPVWPCKTPRRQICIEGKGFFENCDAKQISERHSMDLVYDQMRNWAEWWKEWLLDTQNPSNGTPGSKTIELCRYQEGIADVEECTADVYKYRVCVSAKEGTVSECSKMKNSDVPVTICIENSTHKVVTCGNFTSAFLCFSQSGSGLSFRPCRVDDRQACLSPSNTFVKCSSLSADNLNSYKNRRASLNDNSVVESKHTSGIPLCYNIENQVVACREKTEEAVCLNPSSGRIAKCTVLGNKLRNPVHVCIMVSDNNALIVCNGSNLCLFEGRFKVLRTCSDRKQYACVVQGVIKTCPSAVYVFDSPEVEKNSDFANSPRVYVAERILSKAFKRNLRHLCIMHTGHEFAVCREAPKILFMCVGLKSGSMRKCSTYGADEIVMPVCIEEDNKLVVCGKFSRVNICGKNTSILFPVRTCAEQSRYLCFNEGKVAICAKGPSTNRKQPLNSTGRRRHRRHGSISSSYKKYVNSNKNLHHVHPHVMHDLYDDYYEDEKDGSVYGLKEEVAEEETQTEDLPPYDYEDEDKIDRKIGYDSGVRARSDEEILKDINFMNKKRNLDARVASSHLFNEHLCFMDQDNLANCDLVSKKNFACISAYGKKITSCSIVLAPDVAVPICKKVDSPKLMTCDQFSNSQLCFPKGSVEKLFEPCSDETRFACLTKGNVPIKCPMTKQSTKPTNNQKSTSTEKPVTYKKKNLVYRQTSEASVLRHEETPETTSTTPRSQKNTPPPESPDEKFFKLHCHNCTIENTFIVEGDLDDAYPELEEYVFPK